MLLFWTTPIITMCVSYYTTNMGTPARHFLSWRIHQLFPVLTYLRTKFHNSTHDYPFYIINDTIRKRYYSRVFTMYNRISTVYNRVIDTINIQLFMTLISLPICIAWGLPVSTLTVLGNLLFSPFLTAYIFVSSLVFVTLFFSYACKPLLWLLNILTDLWMSALHYMPAPLYIGFSYNIIIIIIPAIAALYIASSCYAKITKTICYAAVLSCLMVYTYFAQYTQEMIVAIPYFDETVHVIITDNTSILFDHGCIGKKISASSWAEYTLLSELTKKTGRTTIDHVIVTQPTIYTFKALMILIQKKAIKTIYIPYWSGPSAKKLYYAFMTCKKACDTHNVHLVRIGYNHYSTLTLHKKATINTDKKCIIRNNIQFPLVQMMSIIDNKLFSSYASSSKKQKNSIRPAMAHSSY